MSDVLKENLNGFLMNIRILHNDGNGWEALSMEKTQDGYCHIEEKRRVELFWNRNTDNMEYKIKSSFASQSQLRLEVFLDEEECFHLIPANIFGDNNRNIARTGEYPMLTEKHTEDVFCSPYWEFRADRAAEPVAILCTKKGAVGISINPYTEVKDGYIRNGVRAELPGRIAVSMGYTNDPVTYVNKQQYEESTRHTCLGGEIWGRIYAYAGEKREEAHKIVEQEYKRTRQKPVYHKTLTEAAKALLDQFVNTNYSHEFENYTNMECHLPKEGTLKSWRPLVEIGWTGGGILAYPFFLAKETLGITDEYFSNAMSPEEIVNRIVSGYHKESGFFHDVTKEDWNPLWEKSSVNGWWDGMHLTSGCHCAYTNGSAVYYILKILCNCHVQREDWKKAALQVLDTVIGLQREDGNYGYTYDYNEKKVVDWDGFAGCWFAAAMPYAYELTKEKKYLDSAERALTFYSKFVRALNCYGTPMDTWKSVDEEGNLAFIRAARQMHEKTNEKQYLTYLEEGAKYQYLWQYGFQARPEYRPLKGTNWNSCGGSVTSVSNPHIHPMAALIIDDLEYLAEKTGDLYHKERAEDLLAWSMQTMELYPEISGYGAYGVLTERYCPSDGLVIEQFENGERSSMWFTYNGWAAANVLEAILEELKKEKKWERKTV